MDGGHDGNAEVDDPIPDLQLEAAVLGLALLGDIQLGHDLDAADDGAGEALVDGFRRRVEAAIDAVLDLEARTQGLQVDIGHAALQGVEYGGVHEPDDRGLVLVREALQVQDVLIYIFFVEHLHLQGFPRLVQDLLPAFGLLQHILDLDGRRSRESQRPLELGPQQVLGHHVQGIRHGQPEHAVPLVHGHEAVLEHQVQGDRLEQGEVHGLLDEVQGGIDGRKGVVRLGEFAGIQGLGEVRGIRILGGRGRWRNGHSPILVPCSEDGNEGRAIHSKRILRSSRVRYPDE